MGIRIPRFNKAGRNNVMNQQETLSWQRQMQAYLQAGEISPEQAKEALATRYLRQGSKYLPRIVWIDQSEYEFTYQISHWRIMISHFKLRYPTTSNPDLSLSQNNLDDLSEILAQSGEEHLVEESIHFQQLNISD